MARMKITLTRLGLILVALHDHSVTGGHVEEQKYWVDDGCPGTGTDYDGSFQPKSYQACVRCCSNERNECVTPEKVQPCGEHKMSFDDATAICAEINHRLCTKEELIGAGEQKGVCCGSGGSCDSEIVWTSTPENPEPEQRYWVDEGCPNHGDDYDGSFQPKSYEASARCCANDGKTCTLPLEALPCGEHKMPFDDAAAMCADIGQQLCTKEELIDDKACCGIGGDCDSEIVWTSTQENPDPDGSTTSKVTTPQRMTSTEFTPTDLETTTQATTTQRRTTTDFTPTDRETTAPTMSTTTRQTSTTWTPYSCMDIAVDHCSDETLDIIDTLPIDTVEDCHTLCDLVFKDICNSFIYYSETKTCTILEDNLFYVYGCKTLSAGHDTVLNCLQDDIKYPDDCKKMIESECSFSGTVLLTEKNVATPEECFQLSELMHGQYYVHEVETQTCNVYEDNLRNCKIRRGANHVSPSSCPK